MDSTLERRLQKRIHVSLYALLFLTALLGISIVMEGCSDSSQGSVQDQTHGPIYAPVVQVVVKKNVQSWGNYYYSGKKRIALSHHTSLK
jgi:hypothetical protein